MMPEIPGPSTHWENFPSGFSAPSLRPWLLCLVSWHPRNFPACSGRIFHPGRFCKIRLLYQNPVAFENVPGSLTFTVCNQFYRRNVVWNGTVLSSLEWKRSSPMGRQEAEGRLRTHPKLSKLERRAAVHDGREPGQAMSKPSSQEEVPARSLQDDHVYMITSALQRMPLEPRPRVERQQGLPRLGVQQAAQLGLEKTKDISERGQ